MTTTSSAAGGGFFSRLLPAPRGGGFAMEEYWVWCGSPIRDDAGTYHLFASRWPRALRFSPHWITNSEIVRAVSKTPAGPYTFEEVVLPQRGARYWDGWMTHNPTIHRAPDGTYLLYYTGTTYDFHPPTVENQLADGTPERHQARANQRIGLATAPSPRGPWTRRDEPIIQPRPGKWDALITTNAAPCVLPDGTVWLAYKSVAHNKDLLRYGMARALHYDGPYERVSDEPIFKFGDGNHIEDAYLWHEGGQFNMLFKDMTGGIGGEKHAGIHASSADCVTWAVSQPPRAYSRTIQWDDGTLTTQGSLERPQLLIEDGVPTHLFCATADGPGGFDAANRTWSMCIPLRGKNR